MTDSIKQRLVSADDMRMNGFAAVADHTVAQAARIAELEAALATARADALRV